MNRARPVDSDASPRVTVTRSRLALAALAYALLVAYASLVPLDAHPLGASEAWGLVAASWPPAIVSKTDFAANLLLQLPFGFLLTGAFSHGRRGRRGAAVLLAIVLAAVLALAIELAQGMFAVRTPSTTDVLAETIGALGGALVWTWLGAWLAAFVDHRWRELGSPALMLLGAYECVWVLWRWMPFDFTLRLPELAQKYRAGLMVVWPGATGAQDFAATLGQSAGQWLLALPLGTAVWLLMRRRRVGRVDGAVLAACGAALGVHVADLVTLSRSIDLGDVAAAGLGAATGVWWAERPFGRTGMAVACAAVIALLLNQWAPFRFSADAQEFGLTPFLAYAEAHPSQAVSEGLLKLQLGFAAAFVGWAGSRSPKVRSLARWAGLFAVVEIGQIFLPGRYSDVTDLLFLSAGALVGSVTRGLFQFELESYEAMRAESPSRRVRIHRD
jgi:VanZ family protein